MTPLSLTPDIIRRVEGLLDEHRRCGLHPYSVTISEYRVDVQSIGPYRSVVSSLPHCDDSLSRPEVRTVPDGREHSTLADAVAHMRREAAVRAAMDREVAGE